MPGSARKRHRLSPAHGRTDSQSGTAAPPPRFVADAMLGSLARKLRIFGFDTLYFSEGIDAELLTVSRRGRRVLLTADKGLFARAQNLSTRAILVEGKTDRARLISVMRMAELGAVPSSVRSRKSRCAACNGELERLSTGDAAQAMIPSKVLSRHRLFYRCESCSRIYWRGGHWGRLRRLLYSLKAEGSKGGALESTEWSGH